MLNSVIIWTAEENIMEIRFLWYLLYYQGTTMIWKNKDDRYQYLPEET